MNRELRFLVTDAFWRWCRDNRISWAELADATGYSPSLISAVYHHPHQTVSARFVERVQGTYHLPPRLIPFRPAGVRFRREEIPASESA